MIGNEKNIANLAGYGEKAVNIEDDPRQWRMEGIDAAVGLEYAGQDAELYREILADYADCMEEQAEAIERAVSEGDIETFTITVHSLKSTSRTVGALEVSNMARELEDNGKNGDWEAVTANLPALLSAYRGLYAVIEPYLIHDGQEKEKKAMDSEAVSGLLSDLAVCLKEYDSARAEEIMADLSEFDFPDDLAAHMEALASALNKFDYEGCMSIVSRWRGEL